MSEAASLRLHQWSVRIGSTETTLLEPAEILAALTDTAWWEWVVGDSTHELDISGGPGFERLLAWSANGDRVPTDQLIEAFQSGRHQLNWGTLRAFHGASPVAILSIAGFDSIWYDVVGDADVIARLATAFAWARSAA